MYDAYPSVVYITDLHRYICTITIVRYIYKFYLEYVYDYCVEKKCRKLNTFMKSDEYVQFLLEDRNVPLSSNLSRISKFYPIFLYCKYCI